MQRFDPIALMVRLVLAAFFVGSGGVVIGTDPHMSWRLIVGGFLVAVGIAFSAAAWAVLLSRR